MDYIILALVGLVVGAIAKFLVPGKQGGGIIVTAILGVIGSLIAGWGAQKLGIQLGGLIKFIASVAGAVVVVFVYSLITKKSDPS